MKKILITLNITFIFCLFLNIQAQNEKNGFYSKLRINSKKINRNKNLPISFAKVLEVPRKAIISLKSTIITDNSEIYDVMDRIYEYYGIPRNKKDIKKHKPKNKIEQTGIGSGVILTKDGYAITNSHVVINASKIEVKLQDNDNVYSAQVIGYDEDTDIAVIKLNENKKDEIFPTIEITNSEKVLIGDLVFAVGSPFNLPATVTMGIVSAKNRRKYGFKQSNSNNLGVLKIENFIQTDAAINIGNSGGAIIDVEGRLIGISTAIFTPHGGNTGIGFAIPINLAIDIASRLVDNEGVIERAFLGIFGKNLNENWKEYFGKKYGALVLEVIKNTPAEKFDIRQGDLILELNNKKLNDFQDLQFHVGSKKPGDKINLKIQRSNEIINKNLTLGTIPKEFKKNKPHTAKARKIKLLKGVQVREIDDEMLKVIKEQENKNKDKNKDKNKKQIKKIKGLFVISVDENSQAFKGGLRSGFIISKIGGKKITTIKEASEQIKKSVRNNIIIITVNSDNKDTMLAIKVELDKNNND